MKRIAAIMSNLGYGGAEIQSIELFNGLYEQGFSIMIVVLEDRRKDLEDRFHNGIKIVYVDRKGYADTAAVSRVAHLLKDYGTDCMVLVDSYPVLYGFLLKAFFRLDIPSIVILHNTVPTSFKRAVQNRMVYAWAVNRMDRIVFVCEKQWEYWRKRYGISRRKSLVIRNGIDIRHFEKYSLCHGRAACRKMLNLPDTAHIFMMNTCLLPQKRHEHMIQALARLKSEGRNIFVVITGDGPRREYIEELSKKLGVNESLRITGFVRDVRPWIMASDVLVLTSTSETLSMAAIESMAMSKPVILSDTGGASEIVRHGVNGYLYPPGNIPRLTECLRDAVDSGCLRQMGHKSAGRAKKLFDRGRMVAEYASLIRAAISGEPEGLKVRKEEGVV